MPGLKTGGDSSGAAATTGAAGAAAAGSATGGVAGAAAAGGAAATAPKDIKTQITEACTGKATDVAAIVTIFTKATLADLLTVVGDVGVMSKLDSENNNTLRPILASQISAHGGKADDAFRAIFSSDGPTMDARIGLYGALAKQRMLENGVILDGVDAVRVQTAFHLYWHVDVSSAPAAAATANGGDNGAPSPAVAARDWPIPTIQQIHKQMSAIPSQDARTGAWKQLSLTNDPSLINRAAYDGSAGNLIVGSNADGTIVQPGGYFTRLTTAAPKGSKTITVDEGPRFKVGDELGIDSDANQEKIKVTGINGNVYTLEAATTKDHGRQVLVQPTDGSGERDINWLDATVRHEIAHSLDGGPVDTSPYYKMGNWALGDANDAGFTDWANAMGGEAAWAPKDKSTINAADRKTIQTAIINTMNGKLGSLRAQFAGDPTHPITVNIDKGVPVIDAAETCFNLGDFFYTQPQNMYLHNGMRFTISWWYGRFQRHSDQAVNERVSDYSIYAPTEFFAEAYTIFYEEAGKPGVKESDYGRLIRNTGWRDWIKTNVHDRGLAPKGTGAAKPAGGPAAAGGAKGAHEANGGGAVAGGAKRGRETHNPGM